MGDPVSTALIIAGGTMLAGSAVQAAGTIMGGRRAQQEAQLRGILAEKQANFEAAQLDMQAGEEFAAGQREMFALRRRKNLALSKLQAKTAGSGFTSTDETALDLAEDIAAEGTLQEKQALAAGLSRAQGLKTSATARRFTGLTAKEAAFTEGRAARTAAAFSAAGTILGGISGSMSRFAAAGTPSGSGGGGESDLMTRYG